MKSGITTRRFLTALGALLMAGTPSFLASCNGTTSESETGNRISLKGKVLGHDGTPVPGVLARLAKAGLADTTDALGRYLIQRDTAVAGPGSTASLDTLGFFVDGKKVFSLGVIRWVDSLIDVQFSPPHLISPPESYTRTAVVGDSVQFGVHATGIPAPTFQWQIQIAGSTSWSDIPGATLDHHGMESVALPDSGKRFRAKACNVLGCDTSEVMELAVRLSLPSTPPVILSPDQPLSRTVVAGDSVQFGIHASGRPAPVYQWQIQAMGSTSWADIQGAALDRYGLDPVALPDSGKRFRVTACNVAGCDTSSIFELKAVLSSPSILPDIISPDHDLTRTVSAGDTVQLGIHATGQPAPHYQWQILAVGSTSWADITGATSDSHALDAAALSDGGKRFRASACNIAGCDTSHVVELKVLPAAP